MIDMTFVEAVAAAISYALKTTTTGGLPDEWHGFSGTAEEAQKLARRVAIQLYVDLDSRTLLDLAMQKIAFEQGVRWPDNVPFKAAS